MTEALRLELQQLKDMPYGTALPVVTAPLGGGLGSSSVTAVRVPGGLLYVTVVTKVGLPAGAAGGPTAVAAHSSQTFVPWPAGGGL